MLIPPLIAPPRLDRRRRDMMDAAEAATAIDVMHPAWVVKLGGSLGGSADARRWVAALAAEAQAGIVLVPGGGPFADAVRAAQAAWGYDDATAHRLAILAMEQYGHVLCGFGAGLVPASSGRAIAAAMRAGRVAVWMAGRMALAPGGPAASWDVTSDALAAWLAGRLGARHLLLVKSAALPAGLCRAADLAANGIVDPALPGLLARSDVAAAACRAGDHAAFPAIVAGTAAPRLTIAADPD
jgi:aspartokinase-like uncharacterized kinase